LKTSAERFDNEPVTRVGDGRRSGIGYKGDVFTALEPFD
jgi:hypothetical protein